MKIRSAFFALAVGAMVAGVHAMGCSGGGCAPATGEATITFTPSSQAAVRTPATCGVADPPYAAGDAFTLTVVGATTGPAPYNVLTLSLRGTSASATAIPLTIPLSSDMTAAALQTATSADTNITFSFARGTDATEIDDTLLSSVVVTVVSVPTADGQELSAELSVTFADGSELSATYTAPVTTQEATCAGASSP
jgi:hypothetical protein